MHFTCHLNPCITNVKKKLYSEIRINIDGIIISFFSINRVVIDHDDDDNDGGGDDFDDDQVSMIYNFIQQPKPGRLN